MPGILSNKMYEAYEWCIDHIFWIIALCIICTVIMQATKAHFTNLPSSNSPNYGTTNSPNYGTTNRPNYGTTEPVQKYPWWMPPWLRKQMM